MDSPTLELARALVRRPSITPKDAGCQTLLAERLSAAGFTVEELPFGEVSNLWARRGTAAPLLCFLGHTDVVPTGPESAWSHPPFQPVVEDGYLYGRGTADMKGSVAAFTTAVERFAASHPGHTGSVAVLITSDEEGPGVDGVRRVMETLGERNDFIDYCLVGEPSSHDTLGDEIKVGRRGSITGRLTVHGEQGHVAYPDAAFNPIHAAAPALAELIDIRWDEGDELFPPTTLQISNIHAGTGADNVIPGEAEVVFNLRYSPAITAAGIQERVGALLQRHRLPHTLEWRHSGSPFVTRGGALVEAISAAVERRTGSAPIRSTGGGTSDGRFVAPTGSEVVELGPVGATIHKVNERVAADDLDALSEIYEDILRRLLVDRSAGSY